MDNVRAKRPKARQSVPADAGGVIFSALSTPSQTEFQSSSQHMALAIPNGQFKENVVSKLILNSYIILSFSLLRVQV